MFGFGKKYKNQIASLQNTIAELRTDVEADQLVIENLRAENAKLKEAAAKKAARKTSTAKKGA